MNFVRVEPYHIQGKLLKNWVEYTKSARSYPFPIYERDNPPIYAQELVNILTQTMPSLSDLYQNQNISIELRNWAKKLSEKDLAYQFNRFAKYLRVGTIDFIKNNLHT